jgi:hypothetical protein
MLARSRRTKYIVISTMEVDSSEPFRPHVGSLSGRGDDKNQHPI